MMWFGQINRVCHIAPTSTEQHAFFKKKSFYWFFFHVHSIEDFVGGVFVVSKGGFLSRQENEKEESNFIIYVCVRVEWMKIYSKQNSISLYGVALTCFSIFSIFIVVWENCNRDREKFLDARQTKCIYFLFFNPPRLFRESPSIFYIVCNIDLFTRLNSLYICVWRQ